MENIKVVSYNILSSKLCNHKTYPEEYYSSDVLDDNNRWELLKEKLDKWINEKYIICMQEIDDSTYAKIQQFLGVNNYSLLYQQYGNSFNGYMGVGIAYPNYLNDYIDNVYIKKIGDIAKEKKPKFENNWYDNWLFNKLGLSNSEKNNILKKIVSRWNTIISIEFKGIIITTLHMPCMFNDDVTMALLSEIVFNYLEELKNLTNKPYLVAGDFNILPNSFPYNVLTGKYKGIINIDNFFSEPFHYFPLFSSLKDVFTSNNSGQTDIYDKEKFYGKHDYTTNVISYFGAKNGEKYNIFKGVLDYIFISSDQKLIDLISEKNEDGIILPNNNEPSDHLPIEIIFKNNDFI
jgi:mRNA deadenylase 3'-5' endonuclease subunit Ccr4